MLWWRKRNEGFEWRDYVRTTILVRREQRRQRLKEVQEAAVHHVKAAGRRGVEASVSGAKIAGRGAWSHAKAGTIAFGRGAARGVVWLGAALAAAIGGAFSVATGITGRVGAPLAERLEPVFAVARGRAGLALMIVAALAGLGAAFRAWSLGVDGDVYAAAAVALLCLLLAGLAFVTDPERASTPQRASASPRDSLLSRLKGGEFALPERAGAPASKLGFAALALVALSGVAGALFHYGLPSVPTLWSATSSTQEIRRPEKVADASKLEGRAIALSGDHLRIDGRFVALDGIEAPEASQVCQRRSGTWRCGAAARDALSALVRGRNVTCDVLSEDENETRGRCYAKGADIAEALVRNGQVFAEGGFFSRYASLEGEAQDAGLGLWAGAVERPQDFRDKRWEEAKKAAPDGCPIKGRVRSGARVYVLPWSPTYDSIRLSAARGERWFCSESEAQAAGWTKGSSS